MGTLPVINPEVPWHRVHKYYSRITDEEAELLRCQTGILKPGRGSRRYLPMARRKKLNGLAGSDFNKITRHVQQDVPEVT